MRIFSIQNNYYNKSYLENNKNNFAKSKNSQKLNLTFNGEKGAAVGSALGILGSVLATTVIATTGPLGICVGLLAGSVGGSAVGHGTEELIDKIKEQNKK